MARLVWILALLVPVLGHAAGATVHASRNGDSFEVEAFAEIEAEITQAWEVLTDYDRLSDFIPGMHESRIVSRSAHHVIVDQRGEAGLLFFTFPMRVRLAIQEYPYERIVSRAIDGNFKELRGSYTLKARGRIIVLRYSGLMTPDFGVPALIGTLLVRNTVAKRFGAMVDEILRRQRLRERRVSPALSGGH